MRNRIAGSVSTLVVILALLTAGQASASGTSGATGSAAANASRPGGAAPSAANPSGDGSTIR